MRKIRVLLTPSSSGMAISAIKALRLDKTLQIITTDVDKLAPGLYLSDRGYLVPRFKDESFYSTLVKIIKKERIDVIIPCLDTILLEFSKRKEELEEVGAKVLVSNVKTIKITRDKWKTCNALKDTIPFPKSFIRKEDVDIRYPLLVKPRCGSGSINVHKINSKNELEFFYRRVENPIIQEFLGGREYTVDCLANFDGNLIVAVPRERLETKAGITVKGKVINDERLRSMAKKISNNLKFFGPFFFQAKEGIEEIPKMTEINARIAGTMCLSSLSGSNILLMSVKMCLGEKIKTPKIKTGLYLSRYWEEMYLTENEIKRKLLKMQPNVVTS